MPRQELTHIVHLRDLAEGPVDLEIEADEVARAALARRFGLDDIEELGARVVVQREGRGMRVSGHFHGKPVQRCVTTDRPVASSVAEDFTVVFLPEIAQAVNAGGEQAVDVDTEEDFEPLISDCVDIGEVVAQSFSLALDPYPRSPEAGAMGEGDDYDENPSRNEEPDSPFAVLKNLRDMT